MTPSPARWSLSRRFVAGVAAGLAAVVWTHGLAAVLRHLGADGAPPAAVALTVAALASALLGAVALPRRGVATAALAGLAGAAAIAVAVPGAWAGALALPPAAAAALAGGRALGRRLPAGLEGLASRRRLAAAAWALLAVVAVVQTGRLATWVTDPEVGFVLTTRNPFWHGHECLPAYLHGAELAARGEPNLYDARHYPALARDAAPASALAMRVEDPYQYPPQFLLLPRAALAVSGDYATLRTVWFALQVTGFAAVFAALALWVGGRAGRTALWLLPAVLAAFPVAHNFQFGQFHLPAVGLAVAAMLAFARRRPAAGGLLLATAILAKLFPAVLLVPLVVGRRWRELAWTAVWGLAATVLALAVLGPAPFVAFVEYQLPRLADGTAFAFDAAWPEAADLVVIDNQGAYGLARKLGAGRPLAAVVGRAFTLLVLAAAAVAAVRLRGASRWGRAALWLALLGLGSMASAGAWGDYVPSVAVWLLALLWARAADGRGLAVALGVASAFQGLLLGTMPIGDWYPRAVMLPVATAGLLLLLGLYAAVLLVSRPGAWRQDSAAAEEPRRDLAVAA